ncbi:acyl-coenzyme A oxidase, peroxisomal-like, partial [Camellia sinensis]|uniref:acyl-coenzyme A oxidase, peroxisomal-like n=1 Tax=Camellia sinensis TaxID=4442 RepID=UPI0010369647
MKSRNPLQMISLSPIIHSPNLNQTAKNDDQPISRRIERLSLHLNPPPNHPDRQVTDTLELQSCVSKTKLSVSTQQFSDYMRGKHRDIQESVFEYFNSRPDLQTPVEISKDNHQELCMRQLLGLVKNAEIRPF